MLRGILLCFVLLIIAGVSAGQTDTTVVTPSDSHETRDNLTPDNTNTINQLSLQLTNTIKEVDRLYSFIYVLLGLLGAIIAGIIALVPIADSRLKANKRLINKLIIDSQERINDHINTKSEEFVNTIEELNNSFLEIQFDSSSFTACLVTYLQGEYEDAYKLFTIILKKNPNHYEARKYRAYCAKRLGNEYSSSAIEDFTIICNIDKYKNDSEVLFEAMHAYLYAGKYDKAIEYGLMCKRIGHTDMESLNIHLADAYKNSSDYDEALKLYDEVIDGNPRAAIAIMHKCNMLFKIGKYDAIIDTYSNALRYNKYSSYYINRARALIERDQPEDWEKALLDLNMAERNDKNDQNLWYTKGIAYYRRYCQIPSDTSLIEKAIDNFKEGCNYAEEKQKPRFYNQLVRSMIMTNNTDEAVHYGKLSVDTNKYYVQNHMAYVSALLSAKKWPAAQKAAENGLNYSRHKSGKSWLLFYSLLGSALQRHDLDKLEPIISKLDNVITNYDSFDKTVWDWSNTYALIKPDILDLSLDVYEELEPYIDRFI